MIARTFRRPPRWRHVGAVALVALLIGASAAALRQLAPAPAGAAPAQAQHEQHDQHAHLSITTAPATWLATGAPVVVRGYGGGHVRLTLARERKPGRRRGVPRGRELHAALHPCAGRPVQTRRRQRPELEARRNRGRAAARDRGGRRHHLRRAGRRRDRELRGGIPVDVRRANAAGGRHHDREPRDGGDDARRAAPTSSTCSAASPRHCFRSRASQASTC